MILGSDVQDDATVISATGQVDATNIARFTVYAESHLDDGRPIIVDLTGLDFLGAQGIPALLWIGERFAGAGLSWALVPTVSSVDEALERVSGRRRLLQLVTKTS